MLKKYRVEIIIFIVALCLRLLFAFFVYEPKSSEPALDLRAGCPFSCADGYYDIAYNLVHNKTYSVSPAAPFIPDSSRAPGYPMLMALSLYIFNSLWPLFIAQIIISSLLPVLGKKISLEITDNTVISNLAAWLLVFEPVGILLSISGITEIFFTLFIYLAVLAILKFIKAYQNKNIFNSNRLKLIILAAIFLGIATLIRPTTFYFPLVLVIILVIYRFFSKQKLLLKEIIIFLAIFIFIISPWLYRNYKILGVASISSIKEDVLFCALAPSVLAVKNHDSYEQSQRNFFKSEGLDGSPTVDLSQASWFQQRAIRVFKNNPKELAIVSGVSLLTFFTHDGALEFLSSLHIVKSTGLTVRQILAQPLPELFRTAKNLFFSPIFFVMLARALWILITFLLVLDIGRSFIKKEFTVSLVFALIFIVYFALTTISNGFGVNARFRFPINIFIFIFAARFLFKIVNFNKYKIL